MKRILIVVFILAWKVLSAQQLTWHTPSFVNGVCIRDSANMYHRLPAELKDQVRPIVWDLSLNTAGEFIHFRSAARSFVIRYTLADRKNMASLYTPATGVSGLDLYILDKNGQWNWAPPGFRFGDTCVYSYNKIMVAAGSVADFYLYLPLRNEVTWLSIGTAGSEQLTFVDERKEKPVVAYGTSILHGAAASRPGMAWSNMLHRKLDREVINLGFSGNGKFEQPIFDLMSKVNASAYILDCIPNLTGEIRKDPADVERRIRYGVAKLRSRNPGVPIIFTEYPDGDIPFYTDTALLNLRHHASLFIAGVCRKLQDEGLKNIFLLSEKEIGFDINSLTETTHPNDIGMLKYADAYEKKLREMLQEPVGSLSTQRPSIQYRDGFNWEIRHEDVIRNTIKTNPKVILFGNSIINYWGGEPLPEITKPLGALSWQKYLAPEKIQNAGFGNDRIENVLWRIYHGELDNFTGKHIVVNIGTNNLSVNTDEEIVGGLSFLLKQIRERKPSAKISIGAIFPRRSRIGRLEELNRKIAAMAASKGYGFFDFSANFMSGEELKADLYLPDGLHLNEKGYEAFGRCFRDMLRAGL